MVDRNLEKGITPREVYVNRRTFLRTALIASSAAATRLLYRRFNPVDAVDPRGCEREDDHC